MMSGLPNVPERFPNAQRNQFPAIHPRMPALGYPPRPVMRRTRRMSENRR